MPEADHPSLLEAFSAARMDRYIARANGDFAEALALYRWNTRVSGELFGLLQHAEVFLRNAIAQQLRNLRVAAGDPTGSWYWHSTDPWFNPWWQPEMVRILRRSERTIRHRHAVTEHRMIAELSFGFWRYLLTAHYESSLWTPALHRAFRPGLARREVYRTVEHLNKLRNRVAHHEPLIDRSVVSDVLHIEQLLDWINPAAADWAMRDATRLDETWQNRPS